MPLEPGSPGQSSISNAGTASSGLPARSGSSCAGEPLKGRGLTRASRLVWHGCAMLIEMAGTTLAAYGGSPGHDEVMLFDRKYL